MQMASEGVGEGAAVGGRAAVDEAGRATYSGSSSTSCSEVQMGLASRGVWAQTSPSRQIVEAEHSSGRLGKQKHGVEGSRVSLVHDKNEMESLKRHELSPEQSGSVEHAFPVRPWRRVREKARIVEKTRGRMRRRRGSEEGSGIGGGGERGMTRGRRGRTRKEGEERGGGGRNSR